MMSFLRPVGRGLGYNVLKFAEVVNTGYCLMTELVYLKVHQSNKCIRVECLEVDLARVIMS